MDALQSHVFPANPVVIPGVERTLKEPETLSLAKIREITKQALDQLAELKQKGLVCGNLKLINNEIQIDFNHVISETDFADREKHKNMHNQVEVSDRPPEMALQFYPYTSATDMWSLGSILYKMRKGESLFQTNDPAELIEKQREVLGLDPHFLLKEDPFKVTCYQKGENKREVDFFTDFMKRLLPFLPEDRFTPEEGQFHPFVNGEYKIGIKLGFGTVAQVFLGNNSGTAFAIKRCRLENDKDYLIKEAKILRMLHAKIKDKSVCIIRYFTIFEIDNKTNIILEYCSGNNLQNELEQTSLTLARIQDIAQQILKTLSFLKEQDLIHADLSAKNIMFKNTATNNIVVFDFGISKFVEDPLPEHTLQVRYVRSPEVYLKARPYTPAIDMWSIGCILCQMVTRQLLFYSTREAKSTLHIDHMRILGNYPPKLIEKAKYLRKKEQFTAEVKKTTSLRQIIEESPIGKSDTVDKKRLYALIHLIELSLEYDPIKRITPEEALQHTFFEREIKYL